MDNAMGVCRNVLQESTCLRLGLSSLAEALRHISLRLGFYEVFFLDPSHGIRPRRRCSKYTGSRVVELDGTSMPASRNLRAVLVPACTKEVRPTLATHAL